MKKIIYLLFLYVNYSTSQYINDAKTIYTAFPKKVPLSIVQYNDGGKYFKLIVTKTTKKPYRSPYTVFGKPFPTHEVMRVYHQIVPDSPYFPIDEPAPHERRSRVKKVLPEIAAIYRHKRSVDRPLASRNASLGDSEKVVRRTKAVKRSNLKNTQKLRSIGRNGSIIRSAAGQRNSKHVARTVKRTPLKRTRYIRIRPAATRPGRSKMNLKSDLKQRNSRLRVKKSKSVGSSHRVRKLIPERLKKQFSRNGTSKLGARKNVKGTDGRRLIAARDALIEEYPYTISIQRNGEHWCSGALLNPRLIITTANCFWRSKSISRMRVRAGSRHTHRGGQTAKISRVMKHPGWGLRKNPDNDVALAVLDRNIKFSHGVHGVDLPNRVMLPPFDDAWVSSFGSERKDGIYDPHQTQTLQVYRSRLVDREKCNNITLRYGVGVTENFICLAQVGRRAPCTRDTGAPAVSDGVLWGLASWGIRKLCGTERFPAMFSYLASHSNVDFIANATHLLMAEERFYPFADRYPLRQVSVTASIPTVPY